MFTTVRRRLSTLVRPAGLLGLVLATVAATATEASAYEQGVDVSSYQHSTSLDWAKVQATGVTFAFIKATEGRSYTNPYFAGDWAATTQLGIYRGAYHFARPSKGTAAAQARYFIGVAGVAAAQGDLPPVLDLEVTGGLGVSALRTWTMNFLNTVESLTGRTPMIYCSPSFWSTNLGNSTAFTRFPLWIAHYTSAAQPWVPGGWPTWTFWQNTSGGRVTGISGNTDMDRFNGSLQQLQVLAQVPQTPLPPPTTPGPTPAATVTTTQPSTTSLYPGQTVHVSATVTADPTVGGAPLAGRTVALARQLPGSTYQAVTQGVTDATGHVDLVATVDQSASYQAQLVGDSTYASSVSDPIAITVLPRTATSVSIRPTAHRVRNGRRVTLFGHLEAGGTGLAPRHVVLYRHVLGTRGWQKVRTVTSLAPTGWWQAPARQRRATAYRAVFIGGARYLDARSGIVTVRVRR